MGFLDEVKKDSKAQSSERVVSRPSQSAAEFIVNVQPTMHELQRYLRRLADHLDRTDLKQLISYEVQGSKPLSHLKQCEYGVNVDDPDRITKLALRYVCKASRVEDVYSPNKESGERQQQHMWRHRLRFSTKKTADERWHFKLDAFVPVSFEFDLDPENDAIRLKVTNHERLGQLSYRYDAEDINQLFLDELASYIMRRPSRFHELSGDVVPEDTLHQLRKQVAQRQAERDQEADKRVAESTAKKGLFKGLFKR